MAAPEARLLSLSRDLLGTVGADGLVGLANPAWGELLGRPEAGLLGTPFLDLVHPEDRESTAAILRGHAADGHECRVLCADGSERWIAWRIRRGPDGIDLAGSDVTAYRRTRAELQDFAYVASHDLAEPLRMVTSYLELLQRRYGGQLDETADEFIGYAVGGAVRMKALIDDLLAYSRVGSHDMRRVDLDLRELVGLVGHALEPAIEDAGAKVELAGPPVPLRGDATQIAQLLQHLVANAVKFRAPERPAAVTVSAVADGDGVRIDVADNGLGIPAHHQERVFKMFARLHGRDEYEGTGIGLSLCRRIAERHRGRIWLESEPEKGSIFHVWLPGGR